MYVWYINLQYSATRCICLAFFSIAESLYVLYMVLPILGCFGGTHVLVAQADMRKTVLQKIGNYGEAPRYI